MRSNSAVGVVWSSVGGESMSGDGDGRDVRYGFCARAADKAAFDASGVIRVISKKTRQWELSRRRSRSSILCKRGGGPNLGER
jgi:hypothetical protein